MRACCARRAGGGRRPAARPGRPPPVEQAAVPHDYTPSFYDEAARSRLPMPATPRNLPYPQHMSRTAAASGCSKYVATPIVSVPCPSTRPPPRSDAPLPHSARAFFVPAAQPTPRRMPPQHPRACSASVQPRPSTASHPTCSLSLCRPFTGHPNFAVLQSRRRRPFLCVAHQATMRALTGARPPFADFHKFCRPAPALAWPRPKSPLPYLPAPQTASDPIPPGTLRALCPATQPNMTPACLHAQYLPCLHTAPVSSNYHRRLALQQERPGRRACAPIDPAHCRQLCHLCARM